MAHDAKTGIEVEIDFFPHALFLFPPTLVIDGESHKMSWGTHFLPVAPGRHRITIGFMYFFMPWRFEESIEVIVEGDRTSKVEYWGPPWKPGKGSLRVH